MKVLGIESSCDETAAAVVEDGHRLLSNVVASSMDLHVQYGGVVPEIAARSHIEAIIPVIRQALEQANCTWDDIDAIGVSYGAGLGSCLLVGVLTARSLAITHNKPLYACNHVEGHVYANFITATSLPDYQLPTQQPQFPVLALIVSGKHSQLALFQDHFDYTLLGQTHDDAIGEAFDKVAKMLGLPYPGGPSVERKAKEGDPFAYQFPKARLQASSRSQYSDEVQGIVEKRTEAYPKVRLGSIADDNAAIRAAIGSRKYGFSFSGLKTAVLRAAQAACGHDHTLASFKLPELLNEAQKANIAASFQRIAVETLVDKTVQAYKEFRPASVVIAGGVAASPELRRQLAARLPIAPHYTDPKLCTDNGAMIASLTSYKHQLHQPTADPFALDIKPSLSM